MCLNNSYKYSIYFEIKFLNFIDKTEKKLINRKFNRKQSIKLKFKKRKGVVLNFKFDFKSIRRATNVFIIQITNFYCTRCPHVYLLPEIF